MKNLVLSFSLFLVLGFSFANAFAGNEGAHGGDPYGLEFATLGDELSKLLNKYETVHPDLFQKYHFTALRFASSVKSTRLVSGEGSDVILNGNEVDAINTPQLSQILINRTRWRESELSARVKLVLHEYFGILAVEQDRYNASLDFKEFTELAIQEIKQKIPSSSFMVNLFYGRCLSVPSLVQTSTCDDDPARLAQAKSCALAQAEGSCRISGRSQCRLVSMSPTPTISTAVIGLRYCEVLVIMK